MSTPTISAAILIQAHATLRTLEKLLDHTNDKALYAMWADTMRARNALEYALGGMLPPVTITPPPKED